MRARWLGVTVAVLVTTLGAVLPARSGPLPSGPTFNDGDSIHGVTARQIDGRQYDISMIPHALGRPVKVRLLLPTGYADHPDIRYPVLYLFHGTSGTASDWVKSGGAEATTAGLPLIVVMPDAGFNGDGGGWFTNWVDTKTVKGPAQWETFHIDELIPWIDHNLRTVARREGRAIAGLSQGGFGSISYPARHPDMFVSAAAFSGAPDIDYNPVVGVGATAVIDAIAVGLDGVEPDAMFGSRITDEINWKGHDPAELATNLRNVSLWLYTATGLPGPLDSPAPNPAAMGIEAATHGSTISFYQRLQALGVPSHLDDYVLGTHTFAYWARDLRNYVAPLMQVFADPPAPTHQISYQSIDQTWSQWGWSVSLQRHAVHEFSWLTGADAGGFILAGTGTANVATPPFYAPGSTHAVTMSANAGSRTFNAAADGRGRLILSVPLGTVGAPAVLGIPAMPAPGDTTTVTVGPALPRR